jgi:hypothetical protein
MFFVYTRAAANPAQLCRDDGAMADGEMIA